jgi:hypothetical protein
MAYLFFKISALDLNMGYHHIKLDVDAQKQCTIVFPWNTGKYRYKRLPMGWFLMLFKISCLSLFKMEYVETYLEDFLILIKKQIQRSST